MLLTSGNPFKCHEEVLHLQPMVPPKRFDISPPAWGMLRRSRCVQIFLQIQYTSSARCIRYVEPSLEERESVKRYLQYMLMKPSENRFWAGYIPAAAVVHPINWLQRFPIQYYCITKTAEGISLFSEYRPLYGEYFITTASDALAYWHPCDLKRKDILDAVVS